MVSLRSLRRNPVALLLLVLAAISSTAFAADPFPKYTLKIVLGTLSRPTGFAEIPDGSNRWLVHQQDGRVRMVKNFVTQPTDFLDLRSVLTSVGPEQGLIGFALHPNYTTNGRFFVTYTRKSDDSVVLAEHRVSQTNPDTGELTATQILINWQKPVGSNGQRSLIHNGGCLQFGPDGYLYVGFGDGGPAIADSTARDPKTLLGKILRLDVDGGTPYAIPPDNPFNNPESIGAGYLPEVYAMGMRNPWRFSFDSETQRLFVGDVGDTTYEEISIAGPAADLGWPRMEGAHCKLPASGCELPGMTMPILEYTHASNRCSVTGGFVYRGTKWPALHGYYFFADYCTADLWAAREVEAGTWETTAPLTQLPSARIKPASFGVDASNELYLVSIGTSANNGAIFRIEHVATPTPTPSPTPSPSQTPTASPTASPSPSATPDPFLLDSDGDGFSDGYEQSMSTDPENPMDRPEALADVDGNGKASLTDAVELYRQVRGGPLAPGAGRPDLDGNGVVDSKDALLLYRWLLAAPGYEILK